MNSREWITIPLSSGFGIVSVDRDALRTRFGTRIFLLLDNFVIVEAGFRF